MQVHKHVLSLSCGVYGEHGMTVFGNTNNPSVITTSRLATNLVSDYTWCCNMLDRTQSSPPVHRWEKPKANRLKCKVEGVIFSTEGKFDIGICFCNDHGILVQTHTMYFPFEIIVNECEASTLKHELLIALSSSFEVIF
jgi:hypothetical protein